MIDADSDRDPVDVLAEEFVARHRRGEDPQLTEYVRLHPELADASRQTFPAAILLEQLKPGKPLCGALTEGPPLERLGDYRILRQVGRGG